jgi:hypothetical protein
LPDTVENFEHCCHTHWRTQQLKITKPFLVSFHGMKHDHLPRQARDKRNQSKKTHRRAGK